MSPISPQLLSWFLREYGPALVLYARQWCHTPEDVVQEAFCRLAEQDQVPENVPGWLYRVVRNEALNVSRSEARRGRRESEVANRSPRWFEADGADQLDAQQIARLLPELPDDQREAIVTRLWGQLSFEEIGRLSGSSTSTAYRRYQAGITSLRERLGVACPQEKTNTDQTNTSRK
ncbi:MAG: sigma-70 family RNA polymerase sigma factor [Pirellulales bacterium]|nr:sigma-70 family RNA polymerase sigma factor [Pirellulales bacterium]